MIERKVGVGGTRKLHRARDGAGGARRESLRKKTGSIGRKPTGEADIAEGMPGLAESAPWASGGHLECGNLKIGAGRQRPRSSTASGVHLERHSFWEPRFRLNFVIHSNGALFSQTRAVPLNTASQNSSVSPLFENLENLRVLHNPKTFV
jgi:hypothetical protein